MYMASISDVIYTVLSSGSPSIFYIPTSQDFEELPRGVEEEELPALAMWTKSQFDRHVDSFGRHDNASELSEGTFDTIEEEEDEDDQGTPEEIWSISQLDEFLNTRWNSHFASHVNIVGGGDGVAAAAAVQQAVRPCDVVAEYETHSQRFNLAARKVSNYFTRSPDILFYLSHTLYNSHTMIKYF